MRMWNHHELSVLLKRSVLTINLDQPIPMRTPRFKYPPHPSFPGPPGFREQFGTPTKQTQLKCAMKKSPPSFYAHKLISALSLAGGLLLCVATSHAADVTFDLNNTNDDSRFKLVGSAQFFDTGGVTNSRFIDLTDGTGQSCAVLFPDFE